MYNDANSGRKWTVIAEFKRYRVVLNEEQGKDSIQTSQKGAIGRSQLLKVSVKTWYIGTSPVILDKYNKGLTSWWTAFKTDIFYFRRLHNAYSTTLWYSNYIIQRSSLQICIISWWKNSVTGFETSAHFVCTNNGSQDHKLKFSVYYG